MSQLNDLVDALNTISTDVDNTLTEVKTLEDQLAAANANPNVDLSEPLAIAASIRQKLEGVTSAANNATAGSQA